jgi:hypothetical protein
MTIPPPLGSRPIIYKVTYSDVGTAPALDRPSASEVTEAPEAVYQMLQT